MLIPWNECDVRREAVTAHQASNTFKIEAAVTLLYQRIVDDQASPKLLRLPCDPFENLPNKEHQGNHVTKVVLYIKVAGMDRFIDVDDRRASAKVDARTVQTKLCKKSGVACRDKDSKLRLSGASFATATSE